MIVNLVENSALCQFKMIPRERLTRQNRGGEGGGEGKIRLQAASFCLANAVRWKTGALIVAVLDVRLLAVNQGHIGKYTFRAFRAVYF